MQKKLRSILKIRTMLAELTVMKYVPPEFEEEVMDFPGNC